MQSEVTVTSSVAAKMFYLDKKSYLQIYMDKLNRTRRHTMKIVKENFSPFNNWEDSRLKVLMLEVKERILNKDEVLIREKQSQPYIYMLL